MGRALVTDLYELKMAASYLHRSMTGTATFSLFVRELPETRGFLVAAGLEDCLDYLETFGFDDEDLAWLRTHGFDDEMCDALSATRFTGDAHAVPEGTVVLAGEPLIEVTAPLPQAQLVESYLLNQMTYQTGLASKAVRCTLAAGGIELIDFALRRTHGVEASMAVARAAAIAGFAGTSNVEAARRFDLVAAGTMAHSYVEAFADETAAFAAFAEDLPGPYTFLVDTYDTVEGVRRAAALIGSMDLPPPIALRIDSGDLGALAFDARKILDAAGLEDVKIFLSGGLDEYALEELRDAGAPVDAAGVGTRFGVSADAPYLDSVYKLVWFEGRPIVKLSPGKETLPGPKQVWRRPGSADLLAGRDEDGPEGAEPLLQPVLRGGRRVAPRGTLAEARARVQRGLEWLPKDALRIVDPVAPTPTVSEPLRALAAATAARLRATAHLPTTGMP